MDAENDDIENTFLTQDGNEQGVAFGSVDDDIDPNSEHVSQSTRLHHKQREMKEMDNKLAAMKNDYRRRIRLVKQGELRFLDKQRNTIDYLRKFKAFIQETDTKRSRAEKKVQEEKDSINKANSEIARLTRELARLERKRDQKRDEYERYKKQKDYLVSVRSMTDQYGEVDELLVRHRILQKNHDDVQKEAENKLKQMFDYQAKVQALRKKKQNELLVKNSELARGSKELEEYTNLVTKKQNEVELEEVNVREVGRNFCEVLLAIKNIYNRTMLYPITKNLNKKMKSRMAAEERDNKEAEKRIRQKQKQERKRRGLGTKKNGTDENGKDSNGKSVRHNNIARDLKDLIKKLDTVGEKMKEMKKVAEMVSGQVMDPTKAHTRRDLYQLHSKRQEENEYDTNRGDARYQSGDDDYGQYDRRGHSSKGRGDSSRYNNDGGMGSSFLRSNESDDNMSSSRRMRGGGGANGSRISRQSSGYSDR